MTDSEANNSSLPQAMPIGHSWKWLTSRLPHEGLDKLGTWLQADLDEMEATWAHLVTAQSMKRDLRHQFAPSKRSSE